MAVSNHQFARRVGCNYTMASRLRNGARTPSAQMLVKICRAFNLDHGEALKAYGEGREPFAAWLRAKVFDAPETNKENEEADEEPEPALTG